MSAYSSQSFPRGLAADYDPVGAGTRAVVIILQVVTFVALVIGFVVFGIYFYDIMQDVHSLKRSVRGLEETTEQLELIGQLLDNSGLCLSEDCMAYGTQCAVVGDCPVPTVKDGVAVTPGCTFGVCVWLFVPDAFVGSMPPLGLFADKLCKQTIAAEDVAASGCLTAVAVPDGDGVDGCIAFNGCMLVPDEGFLEVVRSVRTPHPDAQSRFRIEAGLSEPKDAQKAANDQSLSVEQRRELLRNNRRVL